ncbi:hypothetical protein PoB_000087800 [Plakobranchus ocellatus]|uniref:Uncharacterized protein n=1 Tax=Plakobranchus ocellatus TaxID=259542 RepID=A0AAV3XVJ2_9GAST|nr:hypothetical protein PoB_000087800 [Plakobranchus ocellatus]
MRCRRGEYIEDEVAKVRTDGGDWACRMRCRRGEYREDEVAKVRTDGGDWACRMRCRRAVENHCIKEKSRFNFYFWMPRRKLHQELKLSARFLPNLTQDTCSETFKDFTTLSFRNSIKTRNLGVCTCLRKVDRERNVRTKLKVIYNRSKPKNVNSFKKKTRHSLIHMILNKCLAKIPSALLE